MPPVKFDDLPKTATEVLNDDYVSAYQLKAKQKTTWNGAVATTTVDVIPGATKDATPAKLSWKFPKPFGISGVCVDKLDMAKDGKYAMEVTCDKASHKIDALTVTGKTDLASLAKSSVGCTYTGIKDAQIKLDMKAADFKDVTLEATYALKDLTIGTKITKKNITAPDVGVRFTAPGLFGAVTALEGFSKFSAYGMYKVQDSMKLAATCTYLTAKDKKAASPTYGVGAVYDPKPGVKVKGKVEQADALTASFALKYEISKGFTATAGGKLTFGEKPQQKMGVTLSIE